MLGLNAATLLTPLREVATAGVVVDTGGVVRARVVEGVATATRVVVGVVKTVVTTSSSFLSLPLSFFVSWAAAVVGTAAGVLATRVACWAKNRMNKEKNSEWVGTDWREWWRLHELQLPIRNR